MQKALSRPRLDRAVVDVLESRKLFAFGVTTTSSSYVVDNGANLTFTVLRGGTTSSTVHLGDVTSVRYNGVEMLAPYSATSRYSHYEQGLSNAAVVSSKVDPAGQWILITADDSAATSGAMIQYYAVRRNDNNIYMASRPIDVNNGPGEGRFLAYLNRGVFTNVEESSNLNTTNATVEGSDVFYNTTTGITKSKYYTDVGTYGNSRRMIDNIYHGATGNGVGAWMFMGNREHSAGGPFFKDIDFQTTGGATELYNVTFSGHTQTEAYRQGLHGPYALQFNNGAAPVTPDYAWMEQLNLSGWIRAADRGALSGTATGIPAGREGVVGLSNANAQYWTYIDPATGAYSINGIQPGTYTETLYDTELAVGTRTVTITAGQTTRADIANTYFTPGAVFRIGTFDGTPKGFLNADKIAEMHPSDSRMSSWTSTPNYVVGTNQPSDFPMAQFMGVNNSQRITFTLTSAQVQASTLRIGITLGFEGGRNRVTVNSGQSYAWTSSIPAASRDLNSRGITRGTYRGDNQLYTYNIPSSALRAGVNTIDLPVVSGSYVAGQTYLSPNLVYDAIELVPTATLTNAPRVTSLAVSPADIAIAAGAAQTFFATARDQFSNVTPANVVWTASRGTINDAGEYVAPMTAGPATITATVGSITRTITVNILDGVPTIVTPASASPSPAFGGRTTLTALANDVGGEASLTYTWTSVGTVPAPVTFAASNGTNAGKSTVATFAAPGTYTFRVTVTNGAGESTTSETNVSVFDKKLWLKADQTSGATLADSSGANNNATLSGSYGYVAGVGGNAVQLTGGAASLPTGIVAGLDDFTISAWVKPDALSTWARVFDFGSSTSSYMFLTARSNTGGVRFAIKPDSATAEQTLNGPALTVGVWTHLAVTLQGNLATLYVNGVAAASNANVTAHPAALGNTTSNLIGDSQFASDPMLLATIDDFRLYGRALTSSAVRDLAVPTVVNAAAATPSARLKSTLSALGDDAAGEGSLTYTWSVVGTAPGTVAFAANGTNAAKSSVATFGRPGAYTLRVTIANAAGQSVTSDVVVNVAAATVAGRNVYYNNSRFDGNDAAATGADDAAIATDKQPLLPGQTATFANYTSFSRGLNGLFIDVAGLPAMTLTTADFAFRVGNTNTPASWAAAPAPTSITLRGGAGLNGSDRIQLLWADNAIQKQWLQVTLLANANTGLAANDVFYFGNAIGEVGNSTSDALVNATDVSATQANPRGVTNRAPIDFRYDFNRDGLVNATDVSIAQANSTGVTTALRLITPTVTANVAQSVTATPMTFTAAQPTVTAGRLSRGLIASLFAPSSRQPISILDSLRK